MLNNKYDEMGRGYERLLFINFLGKVKYEKGENMITEETLSILDEIENLSDMIVQSDVYQTYQYAKDNLENDDEAHLLYQAFLKSKINTMMS